MAGSGGIARVAVRGKKCWRVRERECLRFGRMEFVKWWVVEEVVGSWKKKRGWLGGKRSHGMSKKVRGREVVGSVPGGGEILHCSRTLNLQDGAMRERERERIPFLIPFFTERCIKNMLQSSRLTYFPPF